MLNKMQLAIVKKDITAITANKRMLSVLITVPLVMAAVLPSIFILIVMLTPTDAPDFADLAVILGPSAAAGTPDEIRRTILVTIINNIIPAFFLMIPVMTSSVMAASAFVGEKEKQTLETLLYSPLPLKDIFSAKITASLVVSAAVSLLSFLTMLLVIEAELLVTAGRFMLPGINWLVMIFLVMPPVSILSISLIVRGSAKAQSMEESQQRSVFLILPIVFIAAGQFTGILLLNPVILLTAGAVLIAAAFFMFRGLFAAFQHETLLR